MLGTLLGVALHLRLDRLVLRLGRTAWVRSRDRPFLHAHATFADAGGATVGGHLLKGIEVFAAEVMIRELGGVTLVRHPDEATGLALW